MRYVVFDIETQNSFADVGKNEPALLDLSVISAYDSDTKAYHTVSIDEIEEIWPVFEQADAVVGYNSNHFDLPIIGKYYPGSFSHIKSIDLLEDIKRTLGRRIKLDDIAESTLGVKKDGHGLQAITWWRAGEIDRVKQYCQRDVEITKDVFEYALKNGHVMYTDAGVKKKIDIDTSHWRPYENTATTHSLPF